MNLVQAGYNILTILSIADGVVDDSEKKIIVDFIEKNYEGKFDIEAEDQYLQNLVRDKRVEERLTEAVKYFKDVVCMDNRYKMLHFAFDLIVADGDVSDEESELFSIIGNHWEVDMDLFFQQKREEILTGKYKPHEKLDPNCIV
ncbi:TerB family tellurite resistance protein [bacterium]|nr:TerB family tellurite resistance protein [bacterium]